MTHTNRRRLPAERQSIVHKFTINTTERDDHGNATVVSHKAYLIVGFYDDGAVGEIFVRMSKMGSEVSGFIDAWSIAVSMLLQTGTPLAAICAKFRGQQFEPSGVTGDSKIPFARSPVDYISRYLERRFVAAEPEKKAESA